MLRVVKPTSPMSVGTWILSLYGPFAATAAAVEALEVVAPGPRTGLARLIRPAGSAAGLTAALFAPPVAAYTAVLLADTATPSWHEAYRELPFVFVGSASAAAAGLAMILAPTEETPPVRRLALAGSLLELGMERQMERSMGITAEPLHEGKAGRLMRAARRLTVAGALGSVFAGRSRALAVASGAALLAGSVCTRFGIFEAGQASARDPKYTVVPQRERLARQGPVRHGPAQP